MKDNNLNALAKAMSDQTLFGKIIAGEIPHTGLEAVKTGTHFWIFFHDGMGIHW
mgnify:CR=1 FL=1